MQVGDALKMNGVPGMKWTRWNEKEGMGGREKGGGGARGDMGGNA